MGVAYCPRCQQGVASTAGQAYCPQCGWNLHVAKLQIQSLQRLLPVFLLLLVMLGLLLVSKEDRWEPFLAILVIALLLYAAGMWSLRRSLDRLARVVPANCERLKLSDLPDPAEEENARAQALAGLPRPRLVQLTAFGRFYIGGVVLAAVVIESLVLWSLVPFLLDAGWGALETGSGWLMLAAALFTPALVLLAVYHFARQKWLLVHGETVLARVDQQWKSRGASRIRYEFQMEGTFWRGEAIDDSHRLCAGMMVPVFYDATKVSRQVAGCSATRFYYFVFPGSL